MGQPKRKPVRRTPEEDKQIRSEVKEKIEERKLKKWLGEREGDNDRG